jgi:hypothetical protein
MTVLADRKARLLTVWILGAAALATLGVAVHLHYRAQLALSEPEALFNDFDRWLVMTPRFVHEHADYVDDLLPTPPISLAVFAPFETLSKPNAQLVWVLLKLPLAGLIFWLSAAIAARSGVRLNASAVGLIVACWWLPVVVDMQEGQVNLLALLPLVAALFVVQRDSRSSDIVAGLLIGLAASIKVTPVIFVAYFLWRRRWFVVLAAAAGVAACLLALPALWFGWEQNLQWLKQWTAIMIVPYVASGKVVYSTTQSVGSFALRLLTPMPAFEVHRSEVFEHGYMNIAALDEHVVQLVVRVSMLAVGLLGLWWMRRPLPTFRSSRYVLEIGAVAAFMLWFSERTWVHHYVSFVLTLSAAGMVLSDGALPERSRRLLTGTLVLFAGATLFASEAGRLWGPFGVEWAKALGPFLWLSVLVTLVTLYAAGRSRSA